MKLKKETWKIKSFGGVCEEIFAGGDIPKYNLSKIKTVKYNIPIYSNGEKDKGLFGYTDIKKVTKPSITISGRGTIGYSEIREESFYPAIRLIVVIPNSKILDLYFLKFVISNINFASSGTSIPQLTVPMVKQYKIPIPPLEEQKQIAALFQSIETAIEKVERQEKNLKFLQKIIGNNLVSKSPIFGNLISDKNCNLCTFEAIADCIEKHDKRPLENGITRFIGLEFIEADDFNLRGFGEIEKGTTFTKCFLKSDVLFGKRRAYLRKVAVADFNGICSGDILVLRANKTNMLPELLPYYVASDTFINQAITTSAGSLSPRTKWKDLAVLEIAIPDLKTQGKIVEVFQGLQDVLNQLMKQKATLNSLKQKLLSEILG